MSRLLSQKRSKASPAGFNMNDIAALLQTDFVQQNDKLDLTRIDFDESKADENCLFLGLVCDLTDSTKYLDQAYDNGCRNFVSQVGLDKPDINLILVPDGVEALNRIAIEVRAKHRLPIVGVTGSVGKTTTKEMIYSVLAEGFKTLRSIGNFNTEPAIARRLTNLNQSHQLAVFEVSSKQPGEITRKTRLLRPNLGVITSIGTAHIANYKNQDGIFAEKISLAKDFDEANLLVVNGDDEYLQALKSQTKPYQLVSVGFGQNNDLVCTDYQIIDDSIRFEVLVNGRCERFTIQSRAKHNIVNAMLAIATGLHFKLKLRQIRSGLEQWQTRKDRANIEKTAKFIVINDCYNACSSSMIGALELLNGYASRKVAVLGDIAEMGRFAEAEHRLVGSHVTADLLVTIGQDSRYIGDEAVKLGFTEEHWRHFDNKADFLAVFDSLIVVGDTILVKASRVMELEEIVNFILSQ